MMKVCEKKIKIAQKQNLIATKETEGAKGGNKNKWWWGWKEQEEKMLWNDNK